MTRNRHVADAGEMHATRTEFETVLDAFRVLLAGYRARPGEDLEHIRLAVMTLLLHCVTRHAFTDPAHLTSLDVYGMTLGPRDIHLAAIDEALRLTTPLAGRASNSYWIGDIYQWLTETSIARVDQNGEPLLDVIDDHARRKNAGAYYTPAVLVEALLDTALEPLIDDALGFQPEAHREHCICPRCLASARTEETT